MREAGLVVGRTLRGAARRRRAGRHHRGARRPRRGRDPRRGRRPVVPGLPRALVRRSRIDLRLGQRRDRARHPRRPRVLARRRHHLDRLRRDPRRLARRRRRHRRGRRGRPGARRAARGSPRRRCGAASPRRGSAAGSRDIGARDRDATSASPGRLRHRRGVRRPRHRHRDAPGPARANYGRPRPRAPSSRRAWPGDRADGHPRAPGTPAMLDDDWTVVDGRRQPGRALRAHRSR